MISKEFHKNRREKFLELVQLDTLEIIESGQEKQEKGDQNYKFVVDADFYYLTGFEQPNAKLVVVKTKGLQNYCLFIEKTDAKKARWEGVAYTKESVKADTGLEQVEYLDQFEEYLKKMEASYAIIKKENYTKLDSLRQVKLPEEIQRHRIACEITTKGVKAILDALAPGKYEYEMEAHFDYVLKSHNANHAFHTIAASGENACILHYHNNDRKMLENELILFDLGAEWKHYASDVSRTYPVNGTFTKKQRELYEVVLKGLEEAEKLVKPGQPKHELQTISKDVMAEELLKLGYINKLEEIDEYYYHGSGHFIGLFTHDVGDDKAILEENMMFTLEPGLYFEKEKIGIRIEDTILVTKDGCEILSGGIPKTVEEIETYMKKN